MLSLSFEIILSRSEHYMTNKEKEKLFYNSVKSQSKNWSWKFKSYFTFKVIGDFFYESNFYFDPKTGNIWGWLAFKPVVIDDLFWEISGMSENKRMQLSFRAEAAFKVTSHTIFKFSTVLDDFEKLESKITSLLTDIEIEVQNNVVKISTINQYLELINREDETNIVAALTTLVSLEQYDEALRKLDGYRKHDISSGFRFDKKDYYDVVENYIKKKTKRPFWKFF